MEPVSFHPIANLFPMLGTDELATLADDIKANGLQIPVVLYEGKILDGRNRYTACLQAGVEPRFVGYDGDAPLHYVVSINLHRRHLNESQRAMIAAKIANMRQGERTDLKHSENLPKVSQKDAAQLLNISDRSLRDAKSIQEQAIPEVVAAVESGKLSVSLAATLVDAPPDRQRELIAKDDRKAILAASKQIRSEMAEERRHRRLDAIAETMTRNKPLDGSVGKYVVLYIDPPWAYSSSESDSRVIENHYPTMTLDELASLDVGKIAFDDAVLFLWTTSPKVEEALTLLNRWGFTYRTCAVWDKGKIGMGYYFRQQHELLFVATRGNLPTPAAATRPPSVIAAPRGRHSEKPAMVYEIIEAMYPDLPKIELFSRSPREGWAAWGNEI